MTEDIYRQALQTYGKEAQVEQTLEELAELIKALSTGTSDEIADELVDVQIMCKQLELFYTDEHIEDKRTEKLDKLRERIDYDD